MAGRKKLSKEKLQDFVDNLEEISDLSECDENDDPCWGDFVSSPSDSCLSLPAEKIIEKRLEDMFGSDVNYENVVLETEFAEQPNENLLDILGSSCMLPNLTVSPVRSQDSPFSMSLQQSGGMPANEQDPLFHDHDLPINEVPANSSPSLLVDTNLQNSQLAREQDLVTSNVSDSNRAAMIVAENNSSPQQTHHRLSTRRARTLPRNWIFEAEPHNVPLFDKKAKPHSHYTHKTQPVDVFQNFFPDHVIDIIVEQTNRYAHQKKVIFGR